MTLVRTEDRDGVAILTLDRPRANAFSPELVADLRGALVKSRGARAVVLASSQRIFSGGWDLPTIVSFDRRSMTEFVAAYTDVIRDVFTHPSPVVAALPGHAIAGGIILAMAADERIAAEGEAVFGLSEVNLGVPLPRALYEIFRFQLGDRGAERVAATADNLPLDAALEAGIVDRVVAAADLGEQAFERARILGEPLKAAIAEQRRFAREGAVARFDAGRRNDPFLDFWFAPEARARIEGLVEKLASRKRPA
jgi:enoyl-CoA hydratase/carnithine racemase